jgi:glycosyltransferase involved in cell wall biosynthesis
MNKLAIVIPAYKIDYLDKAIYSIINQSNQNFTLYIGDDCSPYDLYKVVKKYNNENIVYKKFEKNLGGIDLPAHWERCINLIKNENWIWLFSDDDVMGKYCVDLFYKEINDDINFDLYHFNVKVINENDEICSTSLFSDFLTVDKFLNLKFTGKINSYVVDYIFSRSKFEKVNRIQSFDLAWNSDVATWAKIGNPKGLKTIKGDYVYWRKSTQNITPNLKDRNIIIRKYDSNLNFYKWIIDYTRKNKMLTASIVFNLIKWYISSLTMSDVINKKDKIFYLRSAFSNNFRLLYPLGVIYFIYKSYFSRNKYKLYD